MACMVIMVFPAAENGTLAACERALLFAAGSATGVKKQLNHCSECLH